MKRDEQKLHEKNALHHYSLWRYKSKQKYNSIPQRLVHIWRTITNQYWHGYGEKETHIHYYREFGLAFMKNSMNNIGIVLKNLRYWASIWPSNFTSWNITQGPKLIWRKYICTPSIPYSTIHNTQNLETIQMSKYFFRNFYFRKCLS